MRLYFEKQLPCEPQQAWLFVTDPRRVNLWSAVKIYTELTGDRGVSWGVGALRRLQVDWIREPLFELVSISQPGRSFVSRILEEGRGLGASMSIEVQGSGRGSLVSWDLQPLERFVPDKKAFQQLQQSFLENAVRSVCSYSDQVVEPLDMNSDIDADQNARAEALSTLESLGERQRERVERMLRVSDVKVCLAWLLSRTTERALGALHQGDFKHPRWIAEFALQIDHFFETALQEYYTSATTVIESHWQDVFRSLERNDLTLQSSYNAGLDAWLLEDVPRALALTYLSSYREVCDYARFRTDYFALVSALLDAAGETQQMFSDKFELDKAQSAEDLRKLLPSVKSHASRYIQRYPIAEWNAIFDRGARIVHLVQGQVLYASKPSAVQSIARLVPGPDLRSVR